MSARSILIIEDEHALGSALELLVRRMGHLPTVVASGVAGLKRFGKQRFDAVVLDIGLPDMNGLKVLESLRDSGSEVPVLVITAHATLQHAIDSQKSGATAYLNKPLDMDRFRQHLDAMVSPAIAEAVPKPKVDGDSPALIGAAACMRDVFVGIARAATGNLPVLISGPSGSGKSLVARVIHAHGHQAGQPVREISASGVKSWPPGEMTQPGTVVLDEIVDWPDDLQADLARWLSENDSGDTRIMATTTTNPAEAVNRGELREDLYYALCPSNIQLPPLHERSGDIPALCAFFGALQSGGEPPVFTPPVMGALQAHDWPGNVRELRHVLHYAMSMCQGGSVYLSHLPKQVLEATEGQTVDGLWQGELDAVLHRWLDHVFSQPESSLPSYDDLLQQLEGRLLAYLMERHDHRPTRLANEMKLHRATLRQKLQRAGLQQPK